MTPEEFFEREWNIQSDGSITYPMNDRYDRNTDRFNYYDMMDFAERYYLMMEELTKENK